MRDFWYEVGLPIAVIGAMFGAVFSVVIGVISVLEAYQCGKYEAVTGKPTRYEGLTCYVQDKAEWYSWAEYKHRLVTKGEFSK